MHHANVHAQWRSYPSQPRRFFSVELANRALLLVRRVVGDMMEAYGDLLDLHERLEVARQRNSKRRIELIHAELARRVDRFEGYLQELIDIGVEIRDFERGIVDFPCLAAGREVALCWMYGEPSIANWHELEEGFAGRQAIELLMAEEALATGR